MTPQSFLPKIARFFIYIAIASPLVWTLHILFPYAAPQVFLFQAATTIATIIYIWLAVTDKKYRPRWNLLLGSTTVYIVIQALTLFGSIEPINSFFGAADRMMGVWNYLHYYLFFVTTIGLFPNSQDIKKLLVVTALTSLLGSLKFLATTLDIFNQNIDIRFLTVRLPFGNSSFFGNYLAIVMPLILWLFLDAKKRGTKIFLGAIMLINFIVIIRLGSRAALLGILIGAAIWILPIALKNKKIRAASLATIIVFIIGMGILIANRNSATVQNNFVLNKFSSWTTTDSSNTVRLSLNKIGWNSFKARPLLGWGHENIGFAFEQKYDPSFAKAKTTEVWSDRIHNNFLHIMASTGLAGLASYLILLGSFWFILIKEYRRKEYSQLTFLIGISLLIYSIQVFFSFDSPGSVLPLYTVFALIGIKYIPNKSEIKKTTSSTYKIAAPIIGTLGVGALVITHFFLTIQTIKASYHASEALFALPFQYEKFAKEIDAFEISLPNSNPIKGEFYSIVMSNFDSAAKLTKQHPRINKFEEYVLPKVFSTSAQHPTDVRLQHRIGTVLKNRVFRGTSDVDVVIDFWKAFLALSNTRQYVILNLEDLYAYKKDFDSSLELLDQLIKQDPEVAELYWRKGKILTNANRINEATAAFVSAYEAGYIISGNDPDQISVANLFIQNNTGLQYASAIYESAAKLQPNNAIFHSNLGVSYSKQGFIERAKEHTKKAIELETDEEKKEKLEAFLKGLEGK